jgi:hypothetical protein
MVYRLEYWTGYREKHKDAPDVDAVVSLEFEPGDKHVIPILPISMVSHLKQPKILPITDDTDKYLPDKLPRAS